MAFLNYDVAVLLAEHVDMDSMASLMLSSKANYQLIRGYEQSIVKARIAKTVRDPMLRPPLGTLLSSAAPSQPGVGRKVLEPVSFAVAKELESRQHQINTLFGSGSPTSPCGRPLIEAVNKLAPFQNLPPNQMERLTDGLKDACAVADRIADCAALVHLDQKPETSSLNDAVHLARQRYIRSLPPIRLAFLTLLASLVGMEYAQRLQSTHSDPFGWERVTSVKETFLRHGTVVIGALLGPFQSTTEATKNASSPTRPCHFCHARSPSARYYTSQVNEVLADLLEYEGWHWGTSQPGEHDGNVRPVPDSLHMTMLQAFQSPEEEAEEVDQPLDSEDVRKEGDADADWLFNIDILDYDDGNGDEDPAPLMATKLDPREALILKWIKR
jgi:hypothetical protein